MSAPQSRVHVTLRPRRLRTLRFSLGVTRWLLYVAALAGIAALAADGPCTIQGAESASVSFPEFFDTLQRVAE